MDKRDIMINAKKYAIEVQKLFHPNAIVLYGSCSKGTSRNESDIDIAVVFNGFKGNFLETSKKLWRLTWDIDDRIEPILLDSIVQTIRVVLLMKYLRRVKYYNL